METKNSNSKLEIENYEFRIRVSNSSFDFEFLFRVLISSFEFKFLFPFSNFDYRSGFEYRFRASILSF